MLSLLPNLKKLDTVLFSKKERDNAKYVPKMPGVVNSYKYDASDLDRPPEPENAKNQKDENSISY